MEAPETSTDRSTTQEVSQVNAVTRSMSNKMRRRKNKYQSQSVVEANPLPFDNEFARLANIDLSYSPPDSCVGSSSLDSSGTELLTRADAYRGGAGVAGSADREGPQGVVGIPQPSQSTDSVNSSSDVVSVDVNDPIPNLDISSPVLSNSSSVDKLKAATTIDDTLHSCKELAARSENGYSYDPNGILIHTVLFENVPVNRVVVPMSYRRKILTLAHDKTSHTGVRGLRHLLGRHFTWPAFIPPL